MHFTASALFTTLLLTVTPFARGLLKNSGYAIGFGPGFDPTINGASAGAVNATVVKNTQGYCADGNYCKLVTFGQQGGYIELNVKGIPIRGPGPGFDLEDSIFSVKVSARRNYQATSCYTKHTIIYYTANGQVGTSSQQQDYQLAPWGSNAVNSFTGNSQGHVSADHIVSVGCNGASDPKKPPQIYVDALSLSII